MTEMKANRETEHTAFVKSIKDDTDAIALLEQAIAKLAKFHNNKGVKVFTQVTKKADPPPELSWASEGGKYGGKEGENRGIVGILEMIKEDMGKEISTARVEDGEAQRAYEKDSAALLATKRAQEQSKVQAEKEKAALGEKIADTEEFVGQKNLDLNVEKETQTALATNCGWVATHFDSRRDQRNAEIDGLVEAKSYLAGVENDEDI